MTLICGQILTFPTLGELSVTNRTSTGLSDPATNPKPSSGSLSRTTSLGAGGDSHEQPSGATYVVVLLTWLQKEHSWFIYKIVLIDASLCDDGLRILSVTTSIYLMGVVTTDQRSKICRTTVLNPP